MAKSLIYIVSIPDTDTDSHIFSHKNNLLTGNNFPNIQYQPKYQRDPYMMPQSQQVDDQVYRDQLQMTRNDWPQMPQMPPQSQQQPVIQQLPKQNNPVWSEKLPKQVPVESDKVVSNKKQPQQKDSEYSEEYVEGDESQSDGEDATTTVAPKKVS